MLKDDYKDDIFEQKKYKIINNDDGSISLKDVTMYDQVGDTFASKNVNSISKKINNHDLALIKNVEVPVSSFVNSADYTEMYPFHADIPIQGLLATDYVEVNPSPATKDMRCLGPDNQSFDGILRLYATELPTQNLKLSAVLINRRDF